MAQTPPFYTQQPPPPRCNQWAVIAVVIGASAFFILLMAAFIFAVAKRLDIITRSGGRANARQRPGMDQFLPSKPLSNGWALYSMPVMGMKIELPGRPTPYYITTKLTNNVDEYGCYTVETPKLWIRLTGYWLKSKYSDSWSMADYERKRVSKGATAVTGVVQSDVKIDHVEGSRFSGEYTYKGSKKCYEEVAIADGKVHYYAACRYFKGQQAAGHAAFERVLHSIRFTDKPSR